MVLNLLAIFVFFAALMAGMILLWRRLPRASAVAVGEVYCLSCWTPARQFASDLFVCPTCGHDAREFGLAAKKPAAHADPFWRVIWLTAILCLVALATTAALLATFHQFSTVSTDSEFWGDGTNYQRLDLTTNGTWTADGKSFIGEVDGDLISAEGDLVTLEIHGPSLRYEVVDDTGRTLIPLSQLPFDEAAVLQWMSAAKLDPAAPYVQGTARRTYKSICNTLKIQPHEMPGPDNGGLSGGSSGSSFNFASFPPALMPGCVMAWSIAWLLGTWLLLRPARHASPADVVGQGVAA